MVAKKVYSSNIMCIKSMIIIQVQTKIIHKDRWEGTNTILGPAYITREPKQRA